MTPAERDLQDKIGAAEELIGFHIAREEFPTAALTKKSLDLFRRQLQLLKSQSSVKPDTAQSIAIQNLGRSCSDNMVDPSQLRFYI